MVLHDPVTARVFSTEKYSGVKGSPFLFEEWKSGSVVTERGLYKNLKLKLDVSDHTIYFEKDALPYGFKDMVNSFVLMLNEKDSSTFQYFEKGISTAEIRPNQYLQVLAKGKIGLYKLNGKLLSEINEINQGIIKTFTSFSKYFVFRDNAWQQVKLNKENVLDLVKDKNEKVMAFINDKKLSAKKESDFVQIIAYYNAL